MAFEVAVFLSAALLVTVVAALFSKSMSTTVIMLFYASLVLGVIFTIYQGVLVGLLHIITFAGAISVMLLTVVLMTGELDFNFGKLSVAAVLAAVTILVVAAASYSLFSPLPVQAEKPAESAMSLFQFIWTFRPWDLLILVVVFAAAMIAVANLLSKEKGA